MSEDRTQAPSKLRRQQARESGQAAHSTELTGAAGLLAVVVLLGFWGDDLAAALLNVLRTPFEEGMPLVADAGTVVAHLRAAAWGVAWPLGTVVLGGALGALGAHQAQVGGLWAPALLAPNPTRLWALGQGADFPARVGRGAWSILKAVLIVLVTVWVIRSGWDDVQRLSALDTPRLAHAAGAALRHAVLVLAAATLVLGLVDFALQYYRLEALLRLTPEQEREDLRAMEGDPALRARRRRIAR
ncbi:MAG: EscU/YscU/HrcU family type III secretion system export apparatus switch protein, partial [Isosphaeraceae bacterium]|nr:EscU/YscU/HrcU family type III secretion system export apparatus switch protein [Isosphaeraceae bacterium]